MTDLERLKLLKLDLQISTTAVDDRLTNMLSAAKGFIKKEGITLDSNDAEDEELVIMYAAYLWRSRSKDDPVMPRSLRWALNNRLFSEKAGGTSNV